MSNKFFLRKIKIGLGFAAILASAGMYYYVSNEQKHFDSIIREIHNPAPIIAESNDIINNKPEIVSTSKDNKQDNFKPRYIIIYSSEENLSISGAARFAVKISVPLGLSQEELKQNLSHAAWRLLKQKNANAVIIWAYRDDDKLRAGGFTAGKCILAPFGDWSKAAQRHSLDDMRIVFEIADVYNRNDPIYKIGSKAIVSKNSALLYPNDNFDPDDRKLFLRKGTVVTILQHNREFVTTEFLDTYKVAVNGNSKRAGWMFGNDLKPADK